MRITFLGLGIMGGPIARHLAKAGHDVTVYNRTAEKSAAWVAAHGGRSAATPAEAAKDAEVVLACVGADADLRAVTLGPDGAFAAMAPGSLFIDHTTVSAAIARELAEAGAARASTLSTRRCRAGRRAPRMASSPSCAAAPKRPLPAPSR